MRNSIKLIVTVFVCVFLFSIVGATTNTTNFPINSIGANNDARFVIKTLKYEPYPVAVGDCFDVWIKVQNAGQEDAKNARFELIPEYPFSSTGYLIKKYGIISGTVNANNQIKSGETQPQTNQVILKYRVCVSPNANGGKYMLKIKTTSDDKSSVYYTYNLPIEVAKSKVNFEVVFQNYNGAQSAFTITNTGEKTASNIIVKLDNSQWVSDEDRSVNIGDLNDGDSTRFSFYGKPNQKKIKLNISYSDVGETRRNIVKTINIGNIETSAQENNGIGYFSIIMFLVGIIVGVFLVVISRQIHKRKRGK